MLDIRQLGYEVSIKDFHKPATITSEPGTNAIGGGKRKREIRTTNHPKPTSSKSTDRTPVEQCVFCVNCPKAQAKFKINPTCDLSKRTCVNIDHPDCNSFEESEIGKKYTASKKKRYIIAGWGYDDAAKTLIKMVNDLDLYTNEQTHPANEPMLLPSVQHSSERLWGKPSVILRLKDQFSDKHFETEVLIDPASYQNQTTSGNDPILSYVSKDLANKIKLDHNNALYSCSCKPATTCTSTECFISNNCIKLNCILHDDQTRTKEMTISFRIVETLGTTDMIIGLSDVRKYDLTTVFKHMYKYATEDYQNEQKSNDPTEDPTNDQTTNMTMNVSTTSQTPLERRSPTDWSGEDARALARAETEHQQKAKLQDPKLLLIGVKPSRRVIMPPRLQNELIMLDEDLIHLDDRLGSI